MPRILNMPPAVCFLHWEVCESHVPIPWGQSSLPGIYPKGQAVLEDHMAANSGVVKLLKEQDPEVLQRSVTLSPC